MQFAGQRTDENFELIGEPQNWLIKLTEEVLPDPDAVLITGITPQKSVAEGYTEAEFLQLFYKEVLQPDTVICGFNNIRFDDEFMRATLWRNFYDPYEWQWQDGRSRWDLLDVVRMVRALRPDGIQWPFEQRPADAAQHGPLLGSEKGKLINIPSNRLELLAKANKLTHDNAHDALSDVQATVAVARLLKEKQPKMFDYLFTMRDKKRLATLINSDEPQPFVYTSGRYSSAWEKTTVVWPIGMATNGAVLVYDLRQDPAELAKLSDENLRVKAFSRDETTEILPAKALKLNACPAVAPLGVFDEASQNRLGISVKQVEEHLKKLRGIAGFTERLTQLFGAFDEERRAGYTKETDSDFQIYDGFVSDQDKTKQRVVRSAGEDELADLSLDFSDERLETLLPRYKARNFPRSLTAAEREAWEEYRVKRILDGAHGQLSLQAYAARLGELAKTRTDQASQYLLEELQLYAESIAPIVDQ